MYGVGPVPIHPPPRSRLSSMQIAAGVVIMFLFLFLFREGIGLLSSTAYFTLRERGRKRARERKHFLQP